MSVLLPFCDSFDHYDQQGDKWDVAGPNSSINLSGTASRTGIGALLFASGVEGPKINFAAGILSRVVAGTAFYPDGAGGVPKSNIMMLWDSTTNNQQVRVCALATNAIIIFSGNDPFPSQLGQSAPGVLDANSYNYIEVDATISHSATVIVRVNGVVVLTLTGVDTQVAGSNPGADQFQLWGYGGASVSRHDDVYVLDPVAAIGDAFLGAVNVYAVTPTANAAPLQWTPLSGQNFENVDEIPPDGDTSYNFSNTVGQVDQYVYNSTGVPTSSQIQFVQHTLDAKVDSGSRSIASNAGGVTGGTDFVLTSGYTMYKTPYETNPLTGDPWVGADFPADFGPEVTA